MAAPQARKGALSPDLQRHDVCYAAEVGDLLEAGGPIIRVMPKPVLLKLSASYTVGVSQYRTF